MSFDFLLSVARLVGTLVAISLFSQGRPKRPHYPIRVACCVAVFLAASFAVDYVGMAIVPNAPTDHEVAWGAIMLVCTIAVVTPLALFCWDISVWTVIFCVTTGILLQGLAGGIYDLARVTVLVSLIISLGGSECIQAIGLALTCIVIYPIAYALLLRPTAHERQVEVDRGDAAIVIAHLVAIMAVSVFDFMLNALPKTAANGWIALGLRVTHIVIGTFILYVECTILREKKLEAEVRGVRLIMDEQARQYEASRANIEAINIKCHDIRHQIRQLSNGSVAVDLGILDEISREVNVYDTNVTTGNTPLDVILSEKGLLCEQRGITLSSVADGDAVASLDSSDVYALFGNLLDNAIEAVGCEDPECRSIFVVVRKAMGQASIHVENHCSTSVEFANGLPKTTKGDRLNHGFGTRSIRSIVERYGGTLVMRQEDGVFHADIIMPLPEALPDEEN